MNVRCSFFAGLALLTSAAAIVACSGDDDPCKGLNSCKDEDEGTSGSGNWTATTSTSTGSGSGQGGGGWSASSATSSASSGTGGSEVGGGPPGGDCSAAGDTAACRTCCAQEYPEGTLMLQSLVAKGCGCAPGAPCDADCLGQAYCNQANGLPADGSACESCINSIGTTESCALSQIGTCQANVDCAESLSCILSCP